MPFVVAFDQDCAYFDDLMSLSFKTCRFEIKNDEPFRQHGELVADLTWLTLTARDQPNDHANNQRGNRVVHCIYPVFKLIGPRGG